MSENRSCPIMINIEPTYFEAVTRLAERYSRPISSQGRALIIESLKIIGIIDDTHIAAIATGRKVPELLDPWTPKEEESAEVPA